MQYFLVASTCLLYLVAAGLFSKGVWFIEAQQWNVAIGGDAAETGSGPGSYDIGKSVWHVNVRISPLTSLLYSFTWTLNLTERQYGNPELNGGGGWGIFNSLFGWQNSATYGSVISYNVYWIFVIAGFALMRFKETKGHLPFMKAKAGSDAHERLSHSPARSSDLESKDADKPLDSVKPVPERTVSDEVK